MLARVIDSQCTVCYSAALIINAIASVFVIKNKAATPGRIREVETTRMAGHRTGLLTRIQFSCSGRGPQIRPTNALWENRLVCIHPGRLCVSAL